MKFDDFDLYKSVYDVYLIFEKEDKKPRSSDWFIYKSKRKVLTNLVLDKLASTSSELYGQEQILKAWDDFGKNKEKYKLIIATANLYGCKCQFARIGDKCSSIVGVEKLRASQSTTPANCFIVCKKHASNLYNVPASQAELVKV